MKHRDAGIYKGVSFPMYSRDWLSDPAILSAPIECEGAWARTFFTMQLEKRASMTFSLDGWARLWRCSQSRADRIITLIDTHKIADVKRECNGNVTLTCRRLQRQIDSRDKTRERVEKHRCNAPVTAEKVLPASAFAFASAVNTVGDTPPTPQGGEAPEPELPPPPAPNDSALNAEIVTLAKTWANKTGGHWNKAVKDFRDIVQRGLLTPAEINNGIERYANMGDVWPSRVIEALLKDKGKRQTERHDNAALDAKRQRFNALYQAVKSGRVKSVQIGGKPYTVTGCDGDAVVRIRDGDGERSIVVGTVAGVTW